MDQHHPPVEPIPLKLNDLVAMLMALLDRQPDGAINVPAAELVRNGQDQKRVIATQVIELPSDMGGTVVRISVQSKVAVATQRAPGGRQQ